MMSGSVTLTPIFVVGGIGILVSLYENVLGKDNKMSPLFAISGGLVGFGVVLYYLKDLTSEIIQVFMNMGAL